MIPINHYDKIDNNDSLKIKIQNKLSVDIAPEVDCLSQIFSNVPKNHIIEVLKTCEGDKNKASELLSKECDKNFDIIILIETFPHIPKSKLERIHEKNNCDINKTSNNLIFSQDILVRKNNNQKFKLVQKKSRNTRKKQQHISTNKSKNNKPTNNKAEIKPQNQINNDFNDSNIENINFDLLETNENHKKPEKHALIYDQLEMILKFLRLPVELCEFYYQKNCANVLKYIIDIITNEDSPFLTSKCSESPNSLASDFLFNSPFISNKKDTIDFNVESPFNKKNHLKGLEVLKKIKASEILWKEIRKIESPKNTSKNYHNSIKKEFFTNLNFNNLNSDNIESVSNFKVDSTTYLYDHNSNESIMLKKFLTENSDYDQLKLPDIFLQKSLEYFNGNYLLLIKLLIYIFEIQKTKDDSKFKQPNKSENDIPHGNCFKQPLKNMNPYLILSLKSEGYKEYLNTEISCYNRRNRSNEIFETRDNACKKKFTLKLSERLNEKCELHQNNLKKKQLLNFKQNLTIDLHKFSLRNSKKTTIQILAEWKSIEFELRENEGNMKKNKYYNLVGPLIIIAGRGLHGKKECPSIRTFVEKHLTNNKYIFNEHLGTFQVIGQQL
ncbi:uncharacterized protein ASCRUDRAFT_72525 [Ascoidea rubescens DSM 1968]|uniref:Smr domain-containing protein n=1 Tax=Ascoidea rubescens DSM 1968 TaxID=1344418 RepID=A0A1D2VAX9_9ASCO|nr:hypothetical protein ASCRUDRAFT_72525 [Ascoidea rubescens DSM 1968]ODV58597.1 hypothetical protein ASCRUDRAFT_72525 [Ascoidea rubescens DSM 1968]